MPSQRRQQYWTRDDIESIKLSFRREAQVTLSKRARPHAKTIDGGCLLYRLPLLKSDWQWRYTKG
jgi:hypothetical protein